MEKYLLLLIGLIFVLLLIGIVVELSSTAYTIYRVCWEAEDLNAEVVKELKDSGCNVEESICEKNQEFCTRESTTTRVCCPFRKCPKYEGIFC